MNEKTWLISAATLLLAAAPLSATAGPCDAYFNFDGTLADASGNGHDGEMIAKGGVLSTPFYTDGKFDLALMLDGRATMRALLDLHYDGCPQVTISAWIKVSRDAPDNTMHVLSTGGGSGPGLNISGTGLNLLGTENGIYQPQAIRKGSWMFVAGVYDYATGEYALYSGSSRAPAPGVLTNNRIAPQNAFWIGTIHDDWGTFARGVAIDDLRITGQALSTVQVDELRARAPASSQPQVVPGDGGDINVDVDRPPDLIPGGIRSGSAPVGIDDQGQPIFASDFVGPSCESQDDCTSSTYCGRDQMCHPETHAPMQAPDPLFEPTVTLALPPVEESADEEEAADESGLSAMAGARYIKLDYDPSFLVYSGVSGGVGDRTEQVVFTPMRRLPYWIETRENYDKPCTVFVHAREVSSTGDETVPVIKEYDVCDGGLPRINPLTTLRRAYRDPEAGDFKPMTGIEVCNNGINNRVKGIRARVRGITMPGGGYKPNYSTVEFEQRSNCVSWQSMAHCTANTFAIGLRLHYRDGDIASPRDFLSGLELVCAEVRWMESSGLGDQWEPMQ